jgi:hypothetical protein
MLPVKQVMVSKVRGLSNKYSMSVFLLELVFLLSKKAWIYKQLIHKVGLFNGDVKAVSVWHRKPGFNVQSILFCEL